MADMKLTELEFEEVRDVANKITQLMRQERVPAGVGAAAMQLILHHLAEKGVVAIVQEVKSGAVSASATAAYKGGKEL